MGTAVMAGHATVPGALKPYWQVKEEISISHGLLLKADRIVIPTSVRL